MDRAQIPFESDQLDRLMDDSGLDVLVVTSKHNVQYLLGGHRAHFFDYMDAIGISRYLPVLLYIKGRPERAAFFGHRLEKQQCELESLWPSCLRADSRGSTDAIELALAHLRPLGLDRARIGVEMPFIPADAFLVLREQAPKAAILDSVFVLERLRARKSAKELELVREASERVEASMLAVIAAHRPGGTKRDLAEALRREETARGLNFEYCLIAAGPNLNRTPSDQPWREGEVLSLDSGGNYRGYIGDLARMAILGEPDGELVKLLASVDTIQQAAMAAVKAGVIGSEIYRAAHAAVSASEHRQDLHFVAHGMGLITHEAPRLTDRATAGYPAHDAELPLEAGMIISIETTLPHRRRGFIKLEDTVAVTQDGSELYGGRARGWNIAGS